MFAALGLHNYHLTSWDTEHLHNAICVVRSRVQRFATVLTNLCHGSVSEAKPAGVIQKYNMYQKGINLQNALKYVLSGACTYPYGLMRAEP